MYKYILDAIDKYCKWKDLEYKVNSIRDDGHTVYIDLTYRPPMNIRNIEIKFSLDTSTGETIND